MTNGQDGAGATTGSYSTSRQVLSGPPFRGLPQPRLAQARERHGARVPEHGQVPGVGPDFGLGASQRPAGMAGQGVPALDGQAGRLRDHVVGQAPDLLTTHVVDDRAQVAFFGADPINAAALLQPEQHLGDHPRREATQTDLPTAADRPFHQSPAGLVQARIGASRGAQSQLMPFAVPAVGVSALPWAGGDRTARVSLPFRAGRPFSAGPSGDTLAVKGAPETVLAARGACPGDWPEAEKLAGKGLRVLAVAHRLLSDDQALRARADPEAFAQLASEGLVPLGFLGISDTLRPGARRLMTELASRDVRPVVITGDHP